MEDTDKGLLKKIADLEALLDGLQKYPQEFYIQRGLQIMKAICRAKDDLEAHRRKKNRHA